MRKALLACFFANLFLIFSSSAQVSIAPSGHKCATEILFQQALQMNPNLETRAQFEAALQAKMEAMVTQRTNAAYHLPVVFHIIHDGEAEGTGLNISQAVIHAQVNQLNKDFQNKSGSQYPVAASTDIRFGLVQNDPSGAVLATPGINRIDRNSKGWNSITNGYSMNYINSTIKPATIWDPSRFINIWVVPITGNTLGYATYPSLSNLPPTNSSTETNSNAGVVVIPTSLGNVVSPNAVCGSNPINLGRTLTHELGHFFGLLHIWGDANCGTDYVDDTPIHQEPNYGGPSHPKPNTCGTADEMFDNFMDYTNDVVMHTFTAGQVARMQTVMLNSPRRASLATSNAGVVTPTSSNRISFNACNTSLSVSEKAISGSFPSYRDVPVVVNVESAASANATVTVSAGGTAGSGTDYTLVGGTMNFNAGDGSKVVIVRIHDNAVPEPNKTIVLTYSVSGTGVTAGTQNQSYTVTLLDDDHVRPAENTLTLVNQAFETGGSYPAGWLELNGGSATNRFVVSSNGNAGGTGMAAHITNNVSTKPNTYTKTAQSVAAMRLPLFDAAGLTNISVSYKYRIAGEIAGQNAYDYGFLYYAPETSPNAINQLPNAPIHASNSVITGTAVVPVTSSLQNSKFYLGFVWSNDDVDGTDPGFNIDDVLITANGTKIETQVNTGSSFAVTTATINNFKSVQNDRLIATITNVNANLPQLTVSIVEAGTDRPTITTHEGTFMRSRKVIQVTPPTADNTAAYTATFYFTPGEVAAWGASAPSLKILKVNNNTDLSGTVSQADGVIVTPTVNDQLTTDGFISYTATFTGFSKFMLIEPSAVLPVRLLEFKANLVGNKVSLGWKTASEQNNRGFDVERSIDGNSFNTIGFVSGQNTLGTNQYTFEDREIVKGNRYYYRLKQIDVDGRFEYSHVEVVAYKGDEIYTWYPNPVSDKLVIRTSSGAKQTMISVVDISGKTMYKSQGVLTGSTTIPTASWAPGVYTVTISSGEEPVSFKVVRN